MIDHTPKYWLLLFTVLIWTQELLRAQSSYQINSYSVKDGLSSSNCRRILKDKEGFVWITSDKGLNRYDGNSFSTFKHRPDDPKTIASNSCNGMLEDSKGRLWVNTDEGLTLVDRQKQTFTNFFPDSTVMPVLGLSYTQMAEDQTGNIWIGGYYDVLIFNPETKLFKKSGWYDFAKKSGIIDVEKRNSITQSVTRKSDTELWLMTVYGLFSVHTPSMTYTYHPNANLDDYFAFYIHETDKHGTLWIGTYDQCYYTYHPARSTWKHHTCPPVPKDIPDQMLDIKVFSQDTMMMLRSDRIFLYDIKTRQFSKFDMKGGEFSQGKGYFVSFNIDSSHLYFLKTELSPFLHCIQSRSYINHEKIHLPVGFANNHSYVTQKGKILAGDWEKGYIASCDSNSCSIITGKGDAQQLGPLQLYFCASDKQQYFSTSSSIYRWDEGANKAIALNYSRPVALDTELEFRNFVEDKSGNIYVRERNTGIWIIRKGSETIEYSETNIKGTSFSALYYDQWTDKLWLATEKSGLYIIDPAFDSTKNYPLIGVGTTKKGFIHDITGDDKGNVFLLMPAKGLMYIDSRTMKAKLYTTFDGIITDAVRYGYVGSDGFFWFTTEAGLMGFDYKNERFYTFDDEKDARFFNYRIFADHHGNISQNLYPDHIISMDKSIIHPHKSDGKIYLKDASLFGKSIPVDTVFKLNYLQNYLTFTFGYLDQESFRKPDLLYSINDLPWQSMEDLSISMYSMAPGDYRINVRQKYDQDKIFSLQVMIAPPWWKTSWFYTLTGALTVAFVYWAYKKRVSGIRKEEAEKNILRQRITKIEMTALRAQMNPHFIFNCLNSINRFILVNETEAASQYLTKFSRLIRIILDASKEDFITLERELEALKLYINMESMRFQDSFEWKITVDEHVFPDQIQIPPLLLQPYVENAIWHGLMQAPADWGVKKLDIFVHSFENTTIIEIKDNGIGREKSRFLKSKTGDHHKSHGMALTEERLKLMQKMQGTKSEIIIEDLYDEQKSPAGTKVKIILNQS